MAKNYTISFMSLRAGTQYTVNIGGGTGAAIPLKPGAQPFVTEEDSDEDMFAPIRTQTGYLRIVDDGFDAREPAQSFDWKDLIPATDTARPVTLTSVHNGQTVVHWQGFMQAQDFGNTLYGNPQEREFPIQCVLSVTQGTDINYQQTAIQNFAYLLKQIVDSIPSAQRPTSFMIQGGTDAQEWLLKKIDWQNFVSEDGDGNLVARYSMYQCLEDMCRFWGWTARTKGNTLYLTMADDATTEPNWLSMDDTDLATMAGGTAAGTTTDTFDTTTLTGDIFANTSQNDYVQRGYNKAVVTADISSSDGELIKVVPDRMVEEWAKNGFLGDDYINHIYTTDHNSFSNSFMQGECNSGATFNIEKLPAIGAKNSEEVFSVIRIKNQYNENNILASFETKYWHCFSDGMITLKSNIYINGEEIKENDSYHEWGAHKLYVCFGIGTTRDNAMWWDGAYWLSTKKKFIARICGNDGIMWCQDIYDSASGFRRMASFIKTDTYQHGKIFIDIYGCNDLTYNSTDKTLDIADLDISFKRTPSGGIFSFNTSRNDSCQYDASNQNDVRNEFNADCIYASENNSKFGFGVVINSPYFDYLQEISYGGSSITERPEQHLANRVVNYWQTSRRRLEVELRTNTVADITPKYKTTIDGTTGYPIAISHDWRDDITKLTILELPIETS